MDNISNTELGRLFNEEVAIRGVSHSFVAKQLGLSLLTIARIADGKYRYPKSNTAKKVLKWIRVRPDSKTDVKVNKVYVTYEKLTSYEVYSLFLEILECASRLDLPKELLDKISLLLNKLR